MTAVVYTGTSNVRSISAAEWLAAGVTGAADTVWNAANGWSIPVGSLIAGQLALLATMSDFDVNAPDGPRSGSVVVARNRSDPANYGDVLDAVGGREVQRLELPSDVVKTMTAGTRQVFSELAIGITCTARPIYLLSNIKAGLQLGTAAAGIRNMIFYLYEVMPDTSTVLRDQVPNQRNMVTGEILYSQIMFNYRLAPNPGVVRNFRVECGGNTTGTTITAFGLSSAPVSSLFAEER